MAESIQVIRLTRNLRYKLTYIHIFETYLEEETNPLVVDLLKVLIEAQQTAIQPLSRYLRRLEVNIQEVELNQKLLDHAKERTNLRSRLQFIYDGMKRATGWYKMQLLDRQMTDDIELYNLLLELGEIDAAKLWRTKVVMGILRIPTKPKPKEWEDKYPRKEPEQERGWRSYLIEDVRRPSWGGLQDTNLPRPSRYRRPK